MKTLLLALACLFSNLTFAEMVPNYITYSAKTPGENSDNYLYPMFNGPQGPAAIRSEALTALGACKLLSKEYVTAEVTSDSSMSREDVVQLNTEGEITRLEYSWAFMKIYGLTCKRKTDPQPLNIVQINRIVHSCDYATVAMSQTLDDQCVTKMKELAGRYDFESIFDALNACGSTSIVDHSLFIPCLNQY